MDAVAHIQLQLSQLSNPEHAKISSRFFKTGPGEYGEGDVFRGIRVPVIRKLARSLKDTSETDVERLLSSTFHEDRLLALVLMVNRYKKATPAGRRALYQSYLRNTCHINNWDLVDASAEHIVGAYLYGRDRDRLYKLAASKNLWERRVGIMATFHFVRQGDFADTLALCEHLMGDSEDLIHKACGWMLREVGNRERTVEEDFLDSHATSLPRTMLRYAIERFSKERRHHYMQR